jgi:glycerophosphoryl diester phosphodiesterase
MRIKISLLLFIASLLVLQACQPDPQETAKELEKMNFPYARSLNIAHRGARSLASENTLLAAQKGLDLNADLWELDVALTYDGEIVLIHDDTLERTSNAKKVYPNKMPWNVHLFSLEELRQLDFGSWFVEEDPFKQIAAGAVSEAEQQAMHNIQIPTLREALDFTHANNWYVNVEIKDLSGTRGDAVIVEKVVALIEGLDMVDDVIISSFNHQYIIQVKKINPSIRTAALTDKVVLDPLALLEQTGADAFNPGVRYIGDEAVIRKVRDAGYDVYVWTVNDEKTMHRLIDAGVSGIFTDFPQLLDQVLASYEP